MENQYGISPRNLLVCKKKQRKPLFGQFMCFFEHLTMVPFDLDAVVPELMTVQERALLIIIMHRYIKDFSISGRRGKEWLKEATREI